MEIQAIPLPHVSLSPAAGAKKEVKTLNPLELKPVQIYFRQGSLASGKAYRAVTSKIGNENPRQRLATLEEWKARLRHEFLFQTQEGVFVRTGKMTCRPLQTNEKFFAPDASNIVSIEASSEHPCWEVKFSDAGRHYRLKVEFHPGPKAWSFYSSLSRLVLSNEDVCDICGIVHDDSRAFGKCPFLNNREIVEIVGRQITRHSLFIDEMKRTGSKWRLKISLSGTLSALSKTKAK